MADTLSTIEPGIVRETIFNQEYLYFSEPYGMQDPYFADENGTSNVDWMTEAWEKSGSIDSANIDEWIQYLQGLGMKKIDRKILALYIYSGETNVFPYGYYADEKAFQKSEDQRKKALVAALKNAKDLVKNPADTQNPFRAFGIYQGMARYVSFLNDSNKSLSRVLNTPGHYVQGKGWVADEVQPEKELAPFLGIAQAQFASKKNDAFIRAKYAFQAIRLEAAMEKFPEVIRLYDDFFGKSKITGLIRYRALGYKAMALCRSGKKAEAFPLYVDLFDQCPPLRFTARQSVDFVFKPEETEGLISKFTSEHRKTAGYFLAGVAQPRNYSVKSIEGMVRHGIREGETQAMLVRMVQALEKSNMAKDRLALLGLDPKAEDQYDDLIALCEKVGADPKAGQPALWYGVAAYLSLLEGDSAKAGGFLQKAESFTTKNKTLIHQLHVWRTLLSLQTEKKSVSLETQKSLVEDINWASTLNQWGNNQGLFHSLLVLAGEKYLSLMDLPHSILCFEAAQGVYAVNGQASYDGPYNMTYGTANYLIDAIAKDVELTKVGSILGGQKEGPLDGKLKELSRLNPNDILLVRAVRKMRGEDYHGAEKLMSHIPVGYFAPGSKPQGNWNPDAPQDNSICYAQSKTIAYKVFTRRDEIEYLKPKAAPVTSDIRGYCAWMGTLSDKIAAARKKKSTDLSKLLYQQASAYASAWFTGWPEVKTENRAVSTHTYYPETNDQVPLAIPSVADEMKARYDEFEKNTPNLSQKAVEVFWEVLKLGQDKELDAKSIVCQNWVAMNYKHQFVGFGDSPKEDKVYFDNLRLLKKNYSDTDFYAEFAPRCSWLRNVR